MHHLHCMPAATPGRSQDAACFVKTMNYNAQVGQLQWAKDPWGQKTPHVQVALVFLSLVWGSNAGGQLHGCERPLCCCFLMHPGAATAADWHALVLHCHEEPLHCHEPFRFGSLLWPSAAVSRGASSSYSVQTIAVCAERFITCATQLLNSAVLCLPPWTSEDKHASTIMMLSPGQSRG